MNHQNPFEASPKPKSSILKTNIYLKMFAIFIIALLLMIPASMVSSLVNERESTQADAIMEVSSKWSEEQTISGPFLSIPYFRYVKETRAKDSAIKINKVREYLHIMPSKLTIEGDLRPEKRHRGIYEIVVYNSNLSISGRFDKLDFADFDIPLQNIQFDKAEFVVGLNDLRGLEEQVNLNWNNENVSFDSGISSDDVVSTGINALVKVDPNDSLVVNFDLKLELKGSQRLYFTPVGKVTDVKMHSVWSNPSFNGAFLPDTREVNESGFTAHWNVLHLNRNYPQAWTNSRHDFDESAFGIDLILPVDNYQKSYRAIKYAILFVAFTFMTFFFIEILNKKFIHPIQYILVGFSLIVFYTLLLSISEHIHFNLAFMLSVIATIVLVAGYVYAILKSKILTFLITGILTILYAFIFVIIQLQDFALLIGSIGVFCILGVVMYFSRKIDWYNIKMED